MPSDTTIGVSDEMADKLHALKERGESYEDVLNRLLADYDEAEAQAIN